MAIQVSIKELLEAGAHFGHQTSRWNPKMKKFIFDKRGGIDIIDLQKTLVQLKTACEFIAQCVRENKHVLLVGTKKQAKVLIRDTAKKAGLHFVSERWLGGTLTNLRTIRKSVARFDEIEQMMADGTFEKISKKEVSMLQKELDKLTKNLEGIRKMDRLPGAIVIIDPNIEKIAVFEARRLGVPIVALIDTNSNPDGIEYPVACNDDAIKTISLILSKIEQAVLDERGMVKDFDEPKEPEVKAEEVVPEPAHGD